MITGGNNSDLIAQLIVFVCWTGAVFAAGTTWGLFLNLTHLHRTRRWAENLSDRMDIQ